MEVGKVNQGDVLEQSFELDALAPSLVLEAFPGTTPQGQFDLAGRRLSPDLEARSIDDRAVRAQLGVEVSAGVAEQLGKRLAAIPGLCLETLPPECLESEG